MWAAIALVVHDAMKPIRVTWAKRRIAGLRRFIILAWGTTGGQLINQVGLDVTRLIFGPEGRKARLGARIAQDEPGMLVAFVDPMTAMPHVVDVKRLLRLAILHDTPSARLNATANTVLQSISGGRA